MIFAPPRPMMRPVWPAHSTMTASPPPWRNPPRRCSVRGVGVGANAGGASGGSSTCSDTTMNRPTSRVSLSSRTALAAAAREGSVTNASPFVCTPTSYTSTPKWSAILSPVMVATRPVTLTVVGAPSSAAAAPLASTSSSRFERFGEADSRLSFLSFLSFFSFFSFFPPSSSRSRFFEDSPIAATRARRSGALRARSNSHERSMMLT